MGAAPGRLVAVGISGSPSATSKSRVLVAHALAQLEARGAAIRLIDVAALPADALLGDRKSTRLNSSHGYISYAVFCLKKKKKSKDVDTSARHYVTILSW